MRCNWYTFTSHPWGSRTRRPSHTPWACDAEGRRGCNCQGVSGGVGRILPLRFESQTRFKITFVCRPTASTLQANAQVIEKKGTLDGMAEVSLEEISMVMDDIKTFFQRATKGEVEKVLNVQRTYDEVLQLCGAREDEMNDVIREMTKRVANAEESAQPPEDPNAHQERMRKLEEATDACKENIERYKNEVSSLEKQRNNMKQDAESLHVQKRKVEELARREIPRTKHELSLYAHISKIAWHYEHGNRIQGVASDPAKGDAHTFDFDPGNTSKYEIANKLWDLM